MANHREYYKGEGGGFPQVWAMVSFVSSCMFMVCLCTKSALSMHQPTFLFVCVGSYE
jgi:hypothetical protein